MKGYQTGLSCQTHKGSPIEYISIHEDTENILRCRKCFIQNDLSLKNTLIIDDIQNIDENSVLLNWPILEDKEILSHYSELNSGRPIIEPQEEIERFFTDCQNELIDKIQACKQIVLQNANKFITKQYLIEVYNNLAQKSQLKESINAMYSKKQKGYMDLQNLINVAKQQSKENTQILQQNYDLYVKSQKFLIFEDTREQIKKLLNIFEELQQQFEDNNQQSDNSFQTPQDNSFENVEDLTKTCNFMKSEYDKYCKVNQLIQRDKESQILQIKQRKPGYFVQTYYSTVLNPERKYKIRLQIEPFPQQECIIAIGILDKNYINKWVEQSKLYFANVQGNKFTNQIKGNNTQFFDDSDQIKYIEFQVCLKEKFFQISDYPVQNSIVQPFEQEVNNLDPQKDYIFCIKHKNTQTIHIMKFLEQWNNE